MKYVIKHHIKGRLRVHMEQDKMSFEQADILDYYLRGQSEIYDVKVYEQTADAVIIYQGDTRRILEILERFSYDTANVPMEVIETSSRELTAIYKEKLIGKMIYRTLGKLMIPYSIRRFFIAAKSIAYLHKGAKSLTKAKLEVEVLDAIAIGVSLVRGDHNTASSVMFLLSVGELLEEWTHKKSVDDLAKGMALKVSKVWLKTEEQEILVPVSEIQLDDHVIIHAGNIIPFDGDVISGEGMVNQASLTGEPLPVKKEVDGYVYAGTVLEEGELIISVKEVSGSTKYEKIVQMIEDSEKLKSASESKASHLADQLVPYTLLGTGLAYLITRNITKALSVLMVDFSCALKLAMPISVLSAIGEAGGYGITVKGGKYLEAVAEADTIVFDKTGTLTKARPIVNDVITFGGHDKDEMLRIAACLEEHFPHSIAKAVVKAARDKELVHEEMHSKVEYIVAHGISSSLDDKKVVIGSYHFVLEDEQCTIPEGEEEKFDTLSTEYSHLYLAIEHELVAVLYIEDPLREEAPQIMNDLRALGVEKLVMMTGDSDRTAKAIAGKVGVDQYYSEVLPEDKASFVEKEREAGRTVIMIGDGINDSPALSAADVGIAISDGAEIAKEIADITIEADSLYELVTLRKLSNELMKQIGHNYRSIVGINTGLIGLGVTGLIQPTMSALLHNTSTLAISLKNMQSLLSEE